MSSEDTVRGIPGSSPSFTELRRCRECGRTQDGGIRLQRCAGCFHVLYCSKTCQKKGWKAHNMPLANLPSLMQNLGFESFSNFCDVFQQWKDAHGWALHMCAAVAVMQSGGVDASQNPQKMLSFSLTLRRPGDLHSNRNPSLVFRVEDQHLINLEERLARAPDFRAQWELGAPARAAQNAKYATHPLFVGILPTICILQEMPAAGVHYFPQFRSNPAMRPYAEKIAPVRDIVLKDILHLGVGSINAGFPLRCVLGPPEDVLPGRFVRSHGTWTWQQLFSDWSQYRRGQHRGLDETLDGLRSGLPPSALIDLIHSLVLS
ncbi:hypothetical protein K466DRAFT_500833 [Polyporus arcularius HHB13444]|uniref:MYND-type domain-containing protein n=1 Tax=Polyporus arcularius HHB13444 TaxID=1314778 RepID=A0A5C3NXG4_9APHY|nr:hypothetical protein K466DRAFT_500833 [Polyporus arcularius HHB13444]